MYTGAPRAPVCDLASAAACDAGSGADARVTRWGVCMAWWRWGWVVSGSVGADAVQGDVEDVVALVRLGVGRSGDSGDHADQVVEGDVGAGLAGCLGTGEEGAPASYMDARQEVNTADCVSIASRIARLVAM